MKIIAPLAACCAALALTACLDTKATGPRCNPIESSIASTSGDTVTTTTGLRYIETHLGAGATAQYCQPVAPLVSGTLTDGTVFQSEQRVPFIPGSTNVLPGFAEGVVGLRDGGSRTLIIPPNLGYGSQPQTDAAGNVIVPANSTLIFDVSFPPLSP